MGVDEGTVRNYRKYLATPEHERPVEKERPTKLKTPKPMYTLADSSLIRQKMRVLKAVAAWIKEERMVLNEIEYVLHEAGKQLFHSREVVKRIPIPTAKPEDLLLSTRPNPSKWGDFIPNPDYWAEWLARWVAACLPAQEALQSELLQEASLRARSG